MRTGIHLSGRAAVSAGAPPPFGVRHTRDNRTGSPVPYVVLHRIGFALPARVAPDGGELLPRRFTLAVWTAVCFLLHFPYRGVAAATPFFSNGIPPCGVRTFLSGRKTGADARLAASLPYTLPVFSVLRKKRKSPFEAPFPGRIPSLYLS